MTIIVFYTVTNNNNNIIHLYNIMSRYESQTNRVHYNDNNFKRGFFSENFRSNNNFRRKNTNKKTPLFNTPTFQVPYRPTFDYRQFTPTLNTHNKII